MPADESGSGAWSERFSRAARFWEPRRLLYNSVLSAIALAWIAASWPHFRPAFNLPSLLAVTVLALSANVCYCAAYLVDLPMQCSAFRAIWGRRRWALWIAGTLFAILLENYWIADEIYPYVTGVR